MSHVHSSSPPIAKSNRRHIVIAGGGTAGWMAANLMAVKWSDFSNIRITLVESDAIGIIGVGEGSTPQLKGFFDAINIKDSDWMPRCNASYKVGINFENWANSHGVTNNQYFHPFFSDVDNYVRSVFETSIEARRHGQEVSILPNDCFLGAHLGPNGKSPINVDTFPFKVHYGYHFDSHLLGNYLKELAISRGVNHIVGTIEDATLAATGDVKHLQLQSGALIRGDFFIDCTGFRSLLMQQCLNVPFDSFASNLFNDKALVLPTPRLTRVDAVTRSVAMSCGWRWQIPLQNRTGNGYVFSSAHCTEEQAFTEFACSLGLNENKCNAKVLNIKSGQLKQHWVKNCTAFGLSQSFIEPLEATSLDIVQDSILNFMAAYETGGFTNQNRNAYNARTSLRIEGVRDYIVAHYVMSKRTDSNYWLDNTSHKNWSPMLLELYERWMNKGDVKALLNHHEIGNYFPEVSWQCLFSGYDVFPAVAKHSQHYKERLELNRAKQEARRFLQTSSQNYYGHNELLASMSQEKYVEQA